MRTDAELATIPGAYATEIMLHRALVTVDEGMVIGATAWDEPVFPKLTQDIEDGEIWPLFAAILLLDDIAAA